MSSLRRRRRSVLVAALVACALSAGAWAAGALERPELATVDARFALRGDQAPPPDLLVVAIDDVTFDVTGLRWPFPRRVHARVIDRLREAGARVIAYDVQFTEADPADPEGDLELVDAVERAGNVVLATTEVDPSGGSNVFGYVDPGTDATPDEFLASIGARAANASVVPDPGGVLRRMPYSLEGLQSFPVTAARRAGAPAPPREDGLAWVDFHGGPGSVRSVSFVSVLEGRVEREVLAGKTVVVGTTAPSLQDVHATSTSDGLAMSGPEFQAHAISTAQRGFPLGDAPLGVDVALLALMGLAVPLLTLRLSPMRALAAAALGGVGFAAGAQVAFEAGVVVGVVPPLLALGLSAAGALGVHYLAAAVEREHTRRTFARFVPPTVVDDMIDRADGDLRALTEEVDATVLFSDLRGFTTFSETLPPVQVVEILNDYLEEMSAAILEQCGTLTAYLGDGVMAVFGAPLHLDDHADRALAAARQMLVRLDAFNARMAAEGRPSEFRMGIGLNTGRIVAGNLGSPQRMDYTAIGDAVNTAARIEGLTKEAGCPLLIAESTCAALTRRAPDLVEVGTMPVRGRRTGVCLWTVGEQAPPAPPPAPVDSVTA